MTNSFKLFIGLTLFLLFIAAGVSILCFALCKVSGKWRVKDDEEQIRWLKELEQGAKNRVPKKG